MKSLEQASWVDINALRDRLMARQAPSVQGAAQAFAADLAATFSTVVLARVFVVTEFGDLPSAERAHAERAAAKGTTLAATTPVLSLLGTAGREPAWRDRRASAGHRAIPLVSRASVEAAPMLAKLLVDLDVNLRNLDAGEPLATRAMLGGMNKTFFVPDAREAKDGAGAWVIPSRAFVEKYGVRSVFGMGGAYVNGVLAVAIVFTSEALERLAVDRFPSLIGNFKLATSDLCQAKAIYEAIPAA